MVKKHSKLKIIFSFLLLGYVMLVFTSSFIPSSDIHKYLSTRLGIAHLFSFPRPVSILISLISVLFIVKHRIQKQERTQTFFMWLIALFASLILLVSNSGQLPKEIASSQQLRIVEWNCLDHLSKESATTIFKEFDADITVLPEFRGYHKEDFSSKRMEAILKSIDLNPNDYSFFQSDPLIDTVEGNIAPVTIVTKKKLGYAKLDFQGATHFGTAYLKSNNKKMPVIIGLHTAPPLPGLMDSWRRDLNFISSDLIKHFPKSVIIGDFNANLKHGDLSKITTHKDVMSYSSPSSRGTWPSRWQKYFRSSIDHILVPKDGFNINEVETKKLDNSDHVPIFATISIES